VGVHLHYRRELRGHGIRILYDLRLGLDYKDSIAGGKDPAAGIKNGAASRRQGAC